MPDRVELNAALGIIEIESFGVVTKADILDSIEKIKQIQEDTGVENLLVDTTGQETLPNPIEIFEIFSVYPREIKTALLVVESQATARDVDFVETVAANRGKRMKIFHDRQQAQDWLQQ